MSLNFPNNPVPGEAFTSEGTTFIWNGTVWVVAPAQGFQWATEQEAIDGIRNDVVMSPFTTRAAGGGRAGYATANGGPVSDIIQRPAQQLLGETPEFTATSDAAFVDAWYIATPTSSSNTVDIFARLWDVAAGAELITLNSRNGRPPGNPADSQYNPHVSGIVTGLVVGSAYRLRLLCSKQVAEGPVPLQLWRCSVFCL